MTVPVAIAKVGLALLVFSVAPAVSNAVVGSLAAAPPPAPSIAPKRSASGDTIRTRFEDALRGLDEAATVRAIRERPGLTREAERRGLTAYTERGDKAELATARFARGFPSAAVPQGAHFAFSR